MYLSSHASIYSLLLLLWIYHSICSDIRHPYVFLSIPCYTAFISGLLLCAPLFIQDIGYM